MMWQVLYLYLFFADVTSAFFKPNQPSPSRSLELRVYPTSYNNPPFPKRKYPFSKLYNEQYMKRMHKMNRNDSINNDIYNNRMTNDMFDEWMQKIANEKDETNSSQPSNPNSNEIKIIISTTPYSNYPPDEGDSSSQVYDRFRSYKNGEHRTERKSENFEVIKNSGLSFDDIGGYDNIKKELSQCIDLLNHYEKYAKYNVRIPKGLILEGPPGTGKTLIAKALAGEAKVGFIAVSGSAFQEKYVGVGAARIRELFSLAKKNIPCIIFIDEIDAVGRKRSGEGETSQSERDTTLNELLVGLDGFKNTSGILLLGATNRADLLDPALTRPGRIDKRVYIGVPDEETRRHILRIHIRGKPYDESVDMEDLTHKTAGLSGAQIENLLNEAMLYALREDRETFSSVDIDFVMNRIIAGWQPMEHALSENMVDHIAIHEMGHALVSLYTKHHSKMKKVVINLSSPTMPGYTMFEPSTDNIYTREYLFEHLMILLGGRIAEEIIYGVSVTTGAINDFDEALKMAEKMILQYGFGNNVIYPKLSEKYKEKIDDEVIQLLNSAYSIAKNILHDKSEFILECAELLKTTHCLTADAVDSLYAKYQE